MNLFLSVAWWFRIFLFRIEISMFRVACFMFHVSCFAFHVSEPPIPHTTVQNHGPSRRASHRAAAAVAPHHGCLARGPAARLGSGEHQGGCSHPWSHTTYHLPPPGSSFHTTASTWPAQDLVPPADQLDAMVGSQIDLDRSNYRLRMLLGALHAAYPGWSFTCA